MQHHIQHSAVSEFIGDGYYHDAPGQSVPWLEFLSVFAEYLARHKLPPWTEEQVRYALQPSYPVGRGAANIVRVGNLSRRRPRRFVKQGKQIRLSA